MTAGGKTYGNTVGRGLAPAAIMRKASPFYRLPCVKGAGAKRLRDWQVIVFSPRENAGVLLRDQKYQKSAKEGFSSSFANLRALARVCRRKFARRLSAATGAKNTPAERSDIEIRTRLP